MLLQHRLDASREPLLHGHERRRGQRRGVPSLMLLLNSKLKGVSVRQKRSSRSVECFAARFPGGETLSRFPESQKKTHTENVGTQSHCEAERESRQLQK